MKIISANNKKILLNLSIYCLIYIGLFLTSFWLFFVVALINVIVFIIMATIYCELTSDYFDLTNKVLIKTKPTYDIMIDYNKREKIIKNIYYNYKVAYVNWFGFYIIRVDSLMRKQYNIISDQSISLNMDNGLISIKKGVDPEEEQSLDLFLRDFLIFLNKPISLKRKQNV